MLVGLATHVDYFFPKNKVEVVYLDNSVADYYEDFLGLDQDCYQYQISNTQENLNSVVIHFDEQWTIYSNEKVDDETLMSIKEDVLKVRKQHFINEVDLLTKSFIKEYLDIKFVEVYQKEERESSYVWLVISLIYFLIMTYGSLISNEVIYEKATNSLSLMISSIDASEHFWAKLIIGYSSLLIQFLLMCCYVLVWLVVRRVLLGFAGLKTWLLDYSADHVMELSSIPLINIMLCILIIMIGIVTIQVILLIIANSFKNSDDYNNFQSPFYLAMMFIYYYFLVNGNNDFLLTDVAKILSFLPISSILFMPCRLCLTDAGVIEGLVASLIAIVVLLLIIKNYLPYYKKRLLR